MLPYITSGQGAGLQRCRLMKNTCRRRLPHDTSAQIWVILIFGQVVTHLHSVLIIDELCTFSSEATKMIVTYEKGKKNPAAPPVICMYLVQNDPLLWKRGLLKMIQLRYTSHTRAISARFGGRMIRSRFRRGDTMDFSHLSLLLCTCQ